MNTGYSQGQGGSGRQYELKQFERQEYPLSTDIRPLGHDIDEEVHLRDYFGILVRRKWIVLVFFVSLVVTVTLSTFMTKPLYKSSATIRIDKENPNVVNFKDVYQVDRIEADYYETQYKILKSRNIAKRVIKKLELEKNRDFLSGGNRLPSIRSIVSGLVSFARAGAPAKDDKTMEDGIDTGIIDAFLGRVDVTPVPKSQLVRVGYSSYDPELSKTVANAIADIYIGFNIESKFDATQEARIWLEKQIEVMKGKVEASEANLNSYSSDNEMIFLDENKDKHSLLAQKLSELSTELNAATANRIQKEALYKEIRESGTENPVISGNSLMQEFKRQYAVLESEYFNLLKIYKPGYPKMKSMKSQMDTLLERMETEKANIKRGVESDYQTALKREKFLLSAFEKQKNETLEFQKKTVQYQILKREVDTNKELYNNLLQRLKEVGVSATITATNIQVLDKAEYPRAPFKPRKSFNILLSIVLGLIGGAGLAFFVEYLDNTVKDTHEIEKRVNLPALGIIPFQKLSSAPRLGLVTYSDNKSPMAEAFRSIGTFILLSSASKPPKTILVTSPREQEGKTTICINTAMALTKSLGKGVIIDADLRRPTLHRTFKVRNSTGLSTFLSGNMKFNDGLIAPTAIGGLSIITAGPIPPNPSELLGSMKMRELLDALYVLYDFVIVDSAPILGLTDSIHLGSFADGVILVVRAGQTPRNALVETKKILRHINAKILGVVLNGLKEGDLKYGYYSYYYSSYYKERK